MNTDDLAHAGKQNQTDQKLTADGFVFTNAGDEMVQGGQRGGAQHGSGSAEIDVAPLTQNIFE